MSVDKRDYSVNRRLFMVSGIALLIGVISTLAAYLLLKLIYFFTNIFFYQTISWVKSSPALNSLGLWVIAVPAIGGLLVGLLARYGTEKIRGHGIPEAMEAILFSKSKLSPKVAALKPLSSGIVIGSGGPFGAEGPIIMTGGALGSLFAQYLNLTSAERKTLLVAGASAGMTAIFATPVAAVLLAVELLLFELKPRSLLPVALACAVAGFLRPWLFDAGPLFLLQTAPASTIALASCVVAGLFSGGLAILLTHALHITETGFSKLPVHWMWWPAIGGLVVGIGGYFQPRALGVGYDVIGDLLSNHFLLTTAIALLIVKGIIWVIALGSGTSGGILAPVLMLGAGLGLVLAPILPGGSPSLWALVCMSGVLGALLGAPLTAIVFAFELTHDSEALLPLLLTTVVAYGLTVFALKRSIMTEKIARRGLHIYREYSVDPLQRQLVDDLMTREVISIDGDMSVAAALHEYFGFDPANSPYINDPLTSSPPRHRGYPVVSDGRLLGVLDRRALQNAENSSMRCAGLLEPLKPEQVLLAGASARRVAGKMAEMGVNRLPIVADMNSMRLIGIVSLRDLLKPSGSIFQEETVREKLR
jgi:H+/Cl- antiporter ClcA